jgi:hypothetical protein
MVTYSRWYIVPTAGFDETDDQGAVERTYTRPKYSDEPGLTGFAGAIVDESIIEPSYPALIQIYPDVNDWYIVRFYGDDNPGWNALNNISVLGDTRNLATNASDVEAVLNQRFGESLDASEWDARFFVNY